MGGGSDREIEEIFDRDSGNLLNRASKSNKKSI
jgi:hypothetical protein